MVLTTLCQLFHDKIGSGSAKKKRENDDDEDITNMIHSDEEDNDSFQNIPLIVVLKENIQKLSDTLEEAIPSDKIDTAFDSAQIVPLGQVRLKVVELSLFVFKLHSPQINEAIQMSELLAKISQLILNHPWNNFLQLKAIAIYEEIFENKDTSKDREFFLKGSNLGETLIELAKAPFCTHESSKNYRNGYMAVVVKLGLLIQKHVDKKDVKSYITKLGDPWTDFTEGELKKSSDLN